MRFFLALLIIAPIFISAQEKRCAADHIIYNSLRSETHSDFNTWINKKIELQKTKTHSFGSNKRQQSDVYEVPVVFHVIHDGKAVGNGSNLSEERILGQLKSLNDDFQRLNADTVDTPSQFLQNAVDTEIKFILAKQDPEGLPFSGITRTTFTSQSGFSDNDGPIMTSIIQWPPEDYINIYIANLTESLGWGIFPFSDLDGLSSEIKNFREIDGVFLNYKYTGFNDDESLAFTSYGRTLTHEMGHYLGVLHVFHGGCSSSGDYCSDTPSQSKSTLNISSCSSIPNTACDEEERPMIENFMDYTDDGCMNLFTLCQKNRMRAVLQQSPRRKSLLTSHALQESAIVENDLGIREIRSPLKTDCSTSFTPSIQVRNYGSNEISDFQINLKINNQIVETATFNTPVPVEESAVVSFANVNINSGILSEVSYEIVQVNNGLDMKEQNNAKSILLNPSESSIIPHTKSFNVDDDLIGRTELGTSSKWEIAVASDSVALNKAAGIMFYEMSDSINYGLKDILLTKVINVSSVSSALLTFKYAYSGRNSDEFLDELIVGISTDCGNTFPSSNYIYSRKGNSLVTTSKTDSRFLPSSELDWNQVDINITPYLDFDEIQIGFIGVNGGGNNLFIDDIQVTSTNLSAFDLGIRKITNASVVTCNENLSPRLNVRNFGFERITDMELSVSLNDSLFIKSYSGLNIQSGESDDFIFNFEDLNEGNNELVFDILSINDTTDQELSNNNLAFNIYIDNSADTIPIRQTFEDNIDDWVINESSGSPLFDTKEITGRNTVIKAHAYDSGLVGSQSYLVSPNISTSTVKYGAIRFRLAHAERPDYTDNLKILLSENCGRSYNIEVYNKNSSDMATSVSTEDWTPESDSDWISEFVDISDHMIWSNLRIAFVFTNGQGNNLYLDDIEFLSSNDPSQIIPEFNFSMYPNPVVGKHFNLSFKLPKKQTVNVKIIDMAGKIVLNRDLENILNQKYDFGTPTEKGFYLLVVTGPDINQVKRLYIQ
ncbi:MAG: choice-of-anchor J domain-containing protein [Cyclobacteriaceae bacterium]